MGFDGTSTYRQTMNYKVTRKQVTEKFVDTNGVAITPPTGFTQNKKTPMTSNNYTFKQAGTLPDTYQADGKTYKFKGWYKGKTKTNTLTTTKAPSYAVTYDDNDDLNVVYEEVVPRDTWVYPGFYAEFVDEQGKAFTNPLTFSGNYTQFLRKKIVNIFETTGNLYPMIGSKDPSQSNKYKIETQSRIPISATYDGNVTGDVYDKREYGLHDLTITNELKYVDKIEVMNTSLQAADYLVGYVGIDPILIDFPNILHPLERAFIKNTNQRFSINAIFGANGSASTIPRLLRIGGKDQPNQRNVTLMGFDGTTNYKHTMNYKVTRKQVTENFVDTNGTKITPPTGFTQNKKTPMTSNNYTFKQAGTLPDTYTTGGKTYKFKGWYKGKTKPNTLTTTKAPSYAVTYNNDDDLTVVYEEIEFFDFPALTYQFGFVDESGKRVDASTIDLTYDNWHGELLSSVDGWKTTNIEKGQVALTKNNLKEIVYPSHSLEIMNGRHSQYSAANLTFKIPKYYENISVYNKNGTFDTAYPFPTIKVNTSTTPLSNRPQLFQLKKSNNQSFIFNQTTAAAPADVQVPYNLREIVYDPATSVNKGLYHMLDKPIYYYLTNRKVTENFVDTNGTKITPPTGFTQGNQIPMTSNTFKYTAAKALPATYTAGDKTYTFQGWYKGKTKPNTLTTSTTPTYNTTFDGNDDMTAMYKEVTAVYPGFYAQFVDEQGKAFTNPLTLSGNYTEFLRKTGTTVFETKGAFYPMVGKRDTTVTNKYKIETTSSLAVPNNYWTAMPADIANRGYALNNLDITNQMKYVDKIETTYTHTTMYDYTGVSDIGGKPNNTSQTELNPIDKTFVKQTDNTFAIKSIWGNGTFSHIVPKMLLLAESGSFSRLFGFDGTPDYKQTVNYKVTRKQVTENFVDTNGTKITPPTGFTQGNQIPMTSNTFKYTAAKALPATYTAGGKTYTFQGWYKGKTKPNTLTTSTTPTYNTTFDGNDDMTAMYKEEVPKASVALTRTTAETVTSGGNVTWRATITNTSQAPLTTATIKKSTAWTTGLAAPTAMIVTPAGGTAKTVPVTATTWTNGVSLGTDIPVGKSATVQFTTKATGTAGQVLRAGITTSGNYSGVSTSATVRVKDNDQAIVTPTAEGFISVPTFNFGQVGVAGSTQQHSLKKAADYYGNGTRNPYLRIKKTQPNWSLTAQLSQPKSATDSLPTATRLLLGAAPVSSFSNYNQPTELKNAVGTTSAISLNANNTATRIITNQQFTGSNIYQLDFTFNNVKLEVPANQGVKGQQYQAVITWNLVTGP
uniref:WxL domain-containing protein n=1 Tax=Enterococcus faecalis TaxID=1351 RepID=UPI003981DD7A